jgi:hypothetical protein
VRLGKVSLFYQVFLNDLRGSVRYKPRYFVSRQDAKDAKIFRAFLAVFAPLRENSRIPGSEVQWLTRDLFQLNAKAKQIMCPGAEILL